MIRRPPRATRTDTLCPTRRSSDLGPCDAGRERESVRGLVIDQLSDATTLEISLAGAVDSGERVRGEGERPTGGRRNKEDGRWPQPRSTCSLLRSSSRSEEHTSELQSLMRISYAVFCLKKKKIKYTYNT